ncbi:MAG: DUF2167 domain-containing protein [Verrucomicrobiaceae bacterium]|nr:MAG: DUF2167 domain-containing protein [Verrucomicrobiaceae bacterium]
MLRSLFAAALLACSVSVPLFAQEASDEQMAAGLAAAKKIVDSLDYQQGEISLRGGLAKLNVPAEFRYLNPKDSDTVLTKIWGNPPGRESTLGMLVPAEVGVLEPTSWGVIITYDEDGYVKDDEAASIKYNELLKEMQAATREANKVRQKEGYGTVDLVGWAAQPRYDKDAHKMYWAKELKFDGADENTLNYNIRVLGRRGVLVLNAVSSMGQLAEIEKAAPSILSMVEFQEGHRYADFKPGTDKVATYGIAALVTGGVLAKGGFFKVLIGAVLAFKKFAIVGAIALFMGIKSLFGKILGRRQESTSLRG